MCSSQPSTKNIRLKIMHEFYFYLSSVNCTWVDFDAWVQNWNICHCESSSLILIVLLSRAAQMFQCFNCMERSDRQTLFLEVKTDTQEVVKKCMNSMNILFCIPFLFGQRPQRGRWPMLSHRGNFSFFFFFYLPPPRGPNPSLEAQIPASSLKSQSPGLNPSLEAQIPVLRLKSQPWGSNPSLEAQILVPRPKS